ncbi:MAG: hypothetical protein M1825_003453 [Sarcosagium campestre]|nr:MAG: hypothetical protein M1825_003453 [Sarcosagium campestre]
MQWLTYLSGPVAIAACWLYTLIVQESFPKLRDKRICLLIAHPDDEAMFFAPSVLALTNPSLRNHVQILCLSSGDAEGLGEIRRRELFRSARILGIAGGDIGGGDIDDEDDEETNPNVVVGDTEEFPDSMTTHWDPRSIAQVLAQQYTVESTHNKLGGGRQKKKQQQQQHRRTTPTSVSSSTKAAPLIDVLITFDRQGISGHPNHISLYHGSRTFIQSLGGGLKCPVAMYTLTTTSLLRKYLSILDAAFTVLRLLFVWGKRVHHPPTPMMFVSSPRAYRRAQRAMTQAHVSQMRWFRWAWIGVSRYMVVNDLRLEKIPAS